MTSYDAAMAGVIFAGMVWGAIRGVTWQLASIASLVLGFLVSQPLSGPLSQHFPGEPVVARSLAMLTIYAGVSGGVFLTAWIVRATLTRMKFQAFDRHLGMVLGGLEGLLLGLVVTLFVVSLAPGTRGPIFGSPTGKVVGQLMAAIGPVLPDEARGVLAPFLNPSDPAATPTTPTEAAASVPTLSDAVNELLPAAAPTSASAGTKQDRDAKPASLKDLIEQSEERLGKAISDGAAKGVRQAVGGNGSIHGGTTQRR